MSTTLSDLVLQYIELEQAELFTAIPATVVDVSLLELNNTISVQPALNNSDGTSLPVLQDVPVIWPSGGGSLITFPLAVDDDVLIVFSMRSIVEFQLSEEGTVDPYDSRLHNISDGYCLVGVFRDNNNPSPNPTDFEIKYKGSEITIKENGDVEVTTENATLTLETTGDVTVDNTNATLTMTNTGDIDLLNTNANIQALNTGDITLSNSLAAIEALNTGAIDITNATGNITMAVSGDVDVNGATIDAATGNVVTASGADLDALLLAYNTHIHNAGVGVPVGAILDSTAGPCTGATSTTTVPA
ncbi:MAG: hypothetical protein GY804_11840 [Alphaproteobacteria bacterium]|nr:hypothetical protein [Alphaproteobacteria bacterium]